MTRTEAARLAGMERQALHDAILRFNTEGPDGLHGRPRSGRPEQLTPGQQAALKAHILRGPEPERDGVSAWRLVDLCDYVEQTYGVSYSQWGLSCLLKQLNLSRQKTRPSHPKGNPAAQAAFKKELPSKLQAIAAKHPDARFQLWCQDEAHFEQKGRTTRVWYERGVRPSGVVDQRFESLYLFAACRPGTDETFALALPRVSADAMTVFLEHFAQQLEPGVHAALVLDQAGWHDGQALHLLETITLVPLLPATPALNPVERV